MSVTNKFPDEDQPHHPTTQSPPVKLPSPPEPDETDRVRPTLPDDVPPEAES
jgi:hypothetical protein